MPSRPTPSGAPEREAPPRFGGTTPALHEAGLANDTLIRALLRQPVPWTPVWLMRQAGRYLPEYNRTRARAGDFMALCRNPSLAAEIALQPLARFPLDAAIVFSDILTVADAMGLGLSFVEGEGPRLERPLRDAADVARLRVPDPQEQLGYVLAAVSETRRALAGRVPLIGFAGSPYTLACYMIEGRGSSDWLTVKRMLYQRADLMHRILRINAEAVAALLNAQIEAGAQAVMIFDTWGGSLSEAAYREFSLAYLAQVIARLKREHQGARVPSIVFTRGAGQRLEALAEVGCDCVGLDWSVDPTEARRRIGARVALQGNLDPAVLLASPEAIRKETKRLLQAFGASPGHVFNLGHGVLPATPPEHVAVLVETVHQASRRTF